MIKQQTNERITGVLVLLEILQSRDVGPTGTCILLQYDFTRFDVEAYLCYALHDLIIHEHRSV